jgi:hypothetical protein
MDLSKDQQAFYETTRERCKEEVDQINNTIASEVQRVRDLLTSLSNRKAAVLQMYSATCAVLGADNDLAAEEDMSIEF